MAARWFNSLLCLCIASQVLAYALWNIAENSSIWFFLNAATHVLLWGVFLVALKLQPKPNKWTTQITVVGLACALNQFIDEAFFNPKVFELNEKIFVSAIVGHLILVWYYARKS